MDGKHQHHLVFAIPLHGGDDDNDAADELMKIKIHQVSLEQEESSVQELLDQHQEISHNVGFVMWPSAVVLSRWIAKHPSVVLSLASLDQEEGDILELGAGCGLVGLTAATMLRHHANNNNKIAAVGNVIFTDYNPEVLENLGRNIRLNNHLDDTKVQVVGLDFFDQNLPIGGNKEGDMKSALEPTSSSSSWIDLEGRHHNQVRLILAADVLCYSNDALLVANTIQGALVEGGQAIVLSPNNRFGVEGFPQACQSLNLQVHATSILAADVMDDLHQTSAGNQNYNQGRYNFTMFTVDKQVNRCQVNTGNGNGRQN